jgi:hypothetical protein
MTTYAINIDGTIIKDGTMSIRPVPSGPYNEYLAWVAAGGVATVLSAPVPSQADVNHAILFDAASAAITVNQNMATQNAAIKAFCLSISTSVQTDADTATLLGIIKTLCTGVQTLVEHDAEALSQRNGIIRLVINKLDGTT